MKTKLIFVRHAQAEGNMLREFHGWTDSELTKMGHEQAKLVAKKLKDIKIDLLYSSSMKRTLQTARYIADVKGLPIVRTDKLKEINGGDWEGLKFEDLPELYKDAYETWEHRPHEHKMPNGESMDEFLARLIAEVETIIRNNLGKTVCVVTHGTAIKALMCFFLGKDLEEMALIPWYDNTSITVVEKEENRYTITIEGDASHLDEELSTIQNQDWWHENQKRIENLKILRGENMRTKNLMNWLFETNAFRVCSPAKPFWYTSGTIGPYYINTHFLYGSETKANELLKFIDSEKDCKETLTYKLYQKVKENYENDLIFKGLIDIMVEFINEKVNIEEIKYISGGERRDWFFSIMVADLLGIEHITIYKDQDAYAGNVRDEKLTKIENINGAKVLHIADLITEASSYERAWVPVINKLGGKMEVSVVVVDRMQGGGQVLEGLGVESLAMISIDENLFNSAKEESLINEEQKEMLMDYFKNPKEAMRNFLINNKTFLDEALASDPKTAERARLCIENNIYNLNQ